MPFDQSRFDTTGIDRVVPAVTAGAGLGTAPPAPVIDAQADDAQGTITFGTGTAPAAGTILTVTFNRSKDPNRLPKVMLTETNQATLGIDIGIGAVTSTSFTIVQATRITAASQAANTYSITYRVFD